MVVVDEAGAGNEVELVLEALWVLLGVAELVLAQIFVDALDGSLFKHVWTDVQTVNIFESLF